MSIALPSSASGAMSPAPTWSRPAARLRRLGRPACGCGRPRLCRSVASRSPPWRLQGWRGGRP
jgi:hypothetical protein